MLDYYIMATLVCFFWNVAADQWGWFNSIKAIYCSFCRGFWIGILLLADYLLQGPAWDSWALLLPVYSAIFSQELDTRYGKV
jgi:hypothetical protein